jgi:hypothetical protein
LQRLLPLQRLNITPEIIAKPNHRRASDAAHQACKLAAWGKPYDVSAQNDSAPIVPTLFRLAEYHPVGKAKSPRMKIIVKNQASARRTPFPASEGIGANWG